MSVNNFFVEPAAADAAATTVTATTLAILFCPLAAAFVVGAIVGRCCLGGGGGGKKPPSKSLVKRACESVEWAWNRVRSLCCGWCSKPLTPPPPPQAPTCPPPPPSAKFIMLNPAADIFYKDTPIMNKPVAMMPNLQIRADPPCGAFCAARK